MSAPRYRGHDFTGKCHSFIAFHFGPVVVTDSSTCRELPRYQRGNA